MRQTTVDLSKTSLEASRTIYETRKLEYEAAEAEYLKAIEEGNDETAKDWEDTMDQIGESVREAQANMMSSWEESL